jgi:hypothetical protein
VLPRCLSSEWPAFPVAVSGSFVFTPAITPSSALFSALIIHQFSRAVRAFDSSYEKKFIESVDSNQQSCVNENQVSLGETLFTKKVVDACYNLSSTGPRHGSGGLECH